VSLEVTDKVDKLFRFPLATIKKIVKLDPDLHMASQVTGVYAMCGNSKSVYKQTR
jgi:hypothetical protein